MVEVEVTDDKVTVHVLGGHRLLALREHVTFDLADGKIATVRGIAAPTRLVRLTEAWRQHGPDTPLITQW